MSDLINREDAIKIVQNRCKRLTTGCVLAVTEIKQLPHAQPDKDKVSNLLYHIYSIQSPHLDVTGVVAKKYYCEELWKELFGKESELPGWMT